MTRRIHVCGRVSVAAVAILCVSIAPAADRDCLFQVSTLDALLAGCFDRAINIGELRRHGDTGLGCFEAMDGEMVMVDGKAYQVQADGSVHVATPDMGSPFASVTFFDRERQVTIGGPLDLAGLATLALAQPQGRNVFCMMRLDGEFSTVKTRSVPRQEKPYPKLTTVAATQPTFEFNNVKGTLVGLYCPYFVAGSNFVGFHWHFLNAARTGGGHVLVCDVKNGTLWLDPTPRYTLVLPQSPEFLGLDIAAPDAAGTKAVEQDQR